MVLCNSLRLSLFRTAKVGTIRRYLEALGGGLVVKYVVGDECVQAGESRAVRFTR